MYVISYRIYSSDPYIKLSSETKVHFADFRKPHMIMKYFPFPTAIKTWEKSYGENQNMKGIS